MAIVRGTNGNDNPLNGTPDGDVMNGFGGDDQLFGQGGNDNMHGDAGNDKLLGGDGNDSLDGGLDGTPSDDLFVQDSDTIDGGAGIDTVTYAQVQHSIDVNLFEGLAFGHGNIDHLTSIENITGTNFNDTLVGDNNANGIQGAAGNDRLDAAGGNDFLSGGGGSDTLIGGAGKDTLFGGTDANSDKFVFALTSDSAFGFADRDVIKDFQHGVDKIDVNQIDAQTGTVGNQNFTFIGAGAFTGEGQVRFFFEGDHTVVALNTTGPGPAESQIELTGHIDLTAADFVL